MPADLILSKLAMLGLSLSAASGSVMVVAQAVTPATDPTSYLTLGGAAVLGCGALWHHLMKERALYTAERAALLKAKDDHISALRARVDEANTARLKAEAEHRSLLERIADIDRHTER